MAPENSWIIHEQVVTYPSVSQPIHVSFEKPMILANEMLFNLSLLYLDFK